MGVLSNIQPRLEENNERLIELAISEGIHVHAIQLGKAEIQAQLEGSSTGCNRNELQSWAAALALRAVQARGIVPAGWNKTAHCQHCGYVHSWHELDSLSCGWCWLRVEGRYFPQPDK
jgi:hypothetical protein